MNHTETERHLDLVLRQLGRRAAGAVAPYGRPKPLRQHRLAGCSCRSGCALSWASQQELPAKSCRAAGVREGDA
jgi:hypothetical protein